MWTSAHGRVTPRGRAIQHTIRSTDYAKLIPRRNVMFCITHACTAKPHVYLRPLSRTQETRHARRVLL